MSTSEASFEVTELEQPENGVFRFELHLDEFAPQNSFPISLKINSLLMEGVEGQPQIDLLGGNNVGIEMTRDSSMELEVSRAVDSFEYAIALKGEFIEDTLRFSAAFFYNNAPDPDFRPSGRLVKVSGITTFQENEAQENGRDRQPETEDQS